MDEFTIELPREAGFSAVAGLVVGGIAARHDVTIDVLDDLQLALDSLLDGNGDGDRVQITLRVGDEAIEASVGPLGEAAVSELEEEAGDRLGLRRLLEATVDEVSLNRRNGAAFVDLRKANALAGAGQ